MKSERAKRTLSRASGRSRRSDARRMRQDMPAVDLLSMHASLRHPRVDLGLLLLLTLERLRMRHRALVAARTTSPAGRRGYFVGWSRGFAY